MDLSVDMQQQAKALADPSRFRMFEYIAAANEPVGVAELTELLGFNHNAIRQHLAVLADTGLVAESNEERKVRGRPRKQYTLRADALNAFSSVTGSYERLAELLLEITTTEDEPYTVGFRAGANSPLDQRSDLAATTEALNHKLADDGFEPVVNESGLTMLQNCPFASVASKEPSIICELHRGLIDGYLSAQQPVVSHELRLRPPHTAGCTVELVAAPGRAN